ncbi:TSUP family transporter, partial [Streptomyces sp. NPDC055134]
LLPAAAAGLLSAHIPAAVLTLAFAALAVLAGLRMLRRRTPSANATVSAPRATGAGAALGAVTGFLGVGGGFLAVPALVAVLAVPMSAAAGTSLLVIIANALIALVARASTEVSLDWALVLPFIATAVLGAWDGKRLSAKVQPAILQRVFGTLLLAVAAVMAIGALL